MPGGINAPALELEELERSIDVAERHGMASRRPTHGRQRTRRRSGGGAAFSRATSSAKKGSGVVSDTLRIVSIACPYRRKDRVPFSVELIGGRFRPGPHFAGQLGLVGQDIHDRGVETVREEGQELRADPIPRNRDVIIRLVVDVLQVPLVEIFP